jgi:hypothetical protein
VAIGQHFFGYRIITTTDEGLLMITPAAERDAPSEFVRQKAARCTRVVRFVAATRGEFPEIPAAKSFTKNYRLLTTEIGIESPIPCGGGVYLYVVWGTYLYGLEAPPGVDVDIPVGGLPPALDTLGPNFRQFPRAKFKTFLDTGAFGVSAKAVGP